jgi:DNA invertase Pin-like site-specific DNA recombinase
MSEIIAYLRVSTDRQGRSGLGLDAQTEAIRRFAQGEKLTLAGEHVEVETRAWTLWNCDRSCA